MTAFPLEIEARSRKLRLKSYCRQIIFSFYFTIKSITNLIVHEKEQRAAYLFKLYQETAKEKRMITRKHLFPKHPTCLIELIGNNPSIVLEEVFPNLEAFISEPNKHIQEKYTLPLKRTTNNTVEQYITKQFIFILYIITKQQASTTKAIVYLLTKLVLILK
ncbi:MAG: hypothetical protein EXX96DRAFT_538994 [Benjaminiella poitrasii]|nr:MAG: hypothetical protein EXX96DRAFT_538994 [Benjaminiella poitrasii]